MGNVLMWIRMQHLYVFLGWNRKFFAGHLAYALRYSYLFFIAIGGTLVEEFDVLC